MNIVRKTATLAGLLALAACGAKAVNEDTGLDSKPLSDLKAQIWVDPNGCQHWFIDDGVEGYLSPRRNRDGTPICDASKSRGGVASASLTTMAVAIWTDQRGCQHWVSDHGAPGYMSERISRTGRPVCKGSPEPSEIGTLTLSADGLFDTGKADLRPKARTVLDEFGEKMQQLGKKRLQIIGHTDSQGSASYNQDLSERRAKAVAAYMQSQFGVTSQTAGQGETSPVADNATQQGRQANRRVDIAVLD
jgi:OOP family OmpA-OmpF porin